MSRLRWLVLGVLLTIAATAELGWVLVRHTRSHVDRFAHLGRHALRDLPSTHAWRGQTSFRLDGLQHDCAALRVEFTEPIAGAVVEAEARSFATTVVLRPPERLEGRTLDLDLGGRCFDLIEVTVHNHLRRTPVVREVSWFGAARREG